MDSVGVGHKVGGGGGGGIGVADLTFDEEIRQEFLAESKEGLERLDRDLVALEACPDNPELLASIFRIAHTIKGTAGFLGFSHLEAVAHAGENLLGQLRDGSLRMDESVATALLAMVDGLRGLIANVEHVGTDGDEGQSVLVARLEELGRIAPPAVAPGAGAPDEGPRAAAALAARAKEIASPGTADMTPSEAPGTPSSAAGPSTMTAPHTAQPSAPEAAAPTSEGLRVDIALVDSLIDLAGELVLVRNEVLQHSTAVSDPTFLPLARRLDVITGDLQDRIMRMRMQPLQTLFSKFPRVVRDLAKACGKSVRVEIDGQSTELDRTLIEAIRDPLLHIVRNAIDHGIESPEERVAKGKPAEGTVSFRAYHTGGIVHIEVGDDGRGIAVDRIRRKAIATGRLDPPTAAALTDIEIQRMIFLPGFSTADRVTNVSGRGVGMDVVKTNVEKAGGLVDLVSRPGLGSTFCLRIPLTLAIIPGVIIHCGDLRFALPQVSVLEFVRVHDLTKVERIHDAAVYRLRGRLLPLVYLDRVLGLDAETGPQRDATGFYIAVVAAAGRLPFGLVVHKLGDTQEIVVKALAPVLDGIEVYSGATILGDGTVALILDVEGVARAADLGKLNVYGGLTGGGGASPSMERGERQDTGDRSLQTTQEPPAKAGASPPPGEERHREFLLVQLAGGGRAAIPLDWVDRIENHPRSAVETSGDHDVVQIRDDIVTVLDIADTLPERRSRPRQPPAADLDPSLLCLIVARGRPASVAAIVERVIDVVLLSPFLKRAGCRAGVEGTTVIDGRVTEVLDMGRVLALAGVDVAGSAAAVGASLRAS